ncbi:3-hydroxyacyl-CoA dehydrogenase family protein [Vibrio sp. DW001]|uniref:3-hydroxyacyl-CoA dehydrogenase family protein n=1 Tax=Vibrio sp. DW001 TaxID=2912315 RepID=UPI0023B1C56C|nr:3-hydroxyacyl-CoA dehydrogenase family protein [Vibrio sp. DW001]WED25829.1 3-hydroxyacyl-CoA dehydrogenase family protein [Vibrio sp. DW001]
MNSTDIKNITIVGGSGMMGVGIAQIFAGGGRNVTIKTRSVTNCTAIEDMSGQLDMFIREGLLASDQKDAILDRISITADEIEAYADADLIFESVPEVMDVKHATFREMEAHAKPTCIFASGTSVKSITEIAEVIEKKDRVIGMHFWNPAVLIPLVEVIRTEDSADDVIQASMDFLTECGKAPAECKKDVAGFLANRLQHALWREAFYMVDQGIADPKTIDDCIKNSFGFRIPQLAPFENADMVSTELSLNIHDYMFQHLYSGTEPSETLKKLVAEGKSGFKTGEGFQTWTPEQAVASKEGLFKYLIDQTTYRNSTKK